VKKYPRLALFLALSFLSLAARAEWLLSQTGAQALPGQPLELNLVVLNDTAAAMSAAAPRRLPVRLRNKEGEQAAELVALDAPVSGSIAPGEFRKYRYSLVLPAETSGPLAIELQASNHRLIVLVEAPLPLASGDVQVAPPNHALKPVDTIAQPALQTFEPMYFAVGRRENETTARFQLSFKYRMFDENGWLGKIFAPAEKFYFGYTQTSLWDISGDSAAFRDTSYRPSLFYSDPEIWASPDHVDSLGLMAGVEHESNGRSGEESRSLNTFFVQPTWRRFLNKEWYVGVAPRLWAYLEKDDNADIADYRGYGNLNLRLGQRDGWLFSADLRKGTEKAGSMQLEVSYPLSKSLGSPLIQDSGYLYFQYFNGYGESLLDYDRKGPAQFRFGIAVVR